MHTALDTNILAYAEGIGDVERQQASIGLIKIISPHLVVIPVQCLGELFRLDYPHFLMWIFSEFNQTKGLAINGSEMVVPSESKPYNTGDIKTDIPEEPPR
jgi:hypothetical protein